MEQNKVAFVTGASRGIGACVARGLAEDGWSVALVARKAQHLASLVEELPQKNDGGQQHLAFPLDVSSLDDVERAAANAIESLGPVSLIFNNAAINYPGTLELTPKEFDDLLQVNVRGAWNVARALVPHLKQQGAGHLINLSSIAGTIGFAGAGAYGATKFALRGLNESLFHELVPLGIKVTALCPSWVDTDMASHASFSGDKMIRPEDILESIRYLLRLSPNACIKEYVINCAETYNLERT